MKVEGLLFAILAAFFAIVTPIYWFLSYDVTGTTALALTFGLAFLIAYYLWFTARRLSAPRPEDRHDAEIHEAAGEYGFFSPHSWWPIACAASAGVVFLGLIFGWWLFIIGVAFGAVSVIGLVFQYYRGEHAH